MGNVGVLPSRGGESSKAGRNSIVVEALAEKYGMNIKNDFENGKLNDVRLKGLQEEMAAEILERLHINKKTKSYILKWEFKSLFERLSRLGRILYWAAICGSGHCLQPDIPDGVCFDVECARLHVNPEVGIGAEGCVWSEAVQYRCNKTGRLIVLGMSQLLLKKRVEKVTDKDLLNVLIEVRNWMGSMNGEGKGYDENNENLMSIVDENENEEEEGEEEEEKKEEEKDKESGKRVKKKLHKCAICLSPFGKDPVSLPCPQCRFVFHDICHSVEGRFLR